MAGRDTPRSPDPDDWFADPERATPRRERSGPRSAQPAPVPADEDDWIAPDPRSRPRGESRLAASLPERWVPIAAAVVLVVTLLVGGLALAGAFSGSPAKPAATTAAISTTGTTLPTTTQSRATTFPAPATPLKPGDTGAQVKVLQRALAHLGYSIGTVDGDYGTATENAVKEFQTAAKLTPDGVFGPTTRAALVRALRSS